MKKFFKFFIIFVLILLILVLLLIAFLSFNMYYMKVSSENERYYDRGINIVPTADYIVVPGAKINANTPLLALQHRLDYAYQLYCSKKAPKIIVSGGFDEEVGRYEPDVMRTYLINLGVEKEDIICDVKGNNTYATLKRVKDFVQDKSVILCTQELYSYRAVFIAKHLNLNMWVYCSDPVLYSGIGKKTIREVLAQTKAILNCSIFVPNNITSLESSPFIHQTEVK